MASSEYQSPFSVAKRQTLYIDANDPRVRGFMASLTAAKAGAEIVIVGDKSIYGATGAFSFLKGAGQQQGGRNLDPKREDFLTPAGLSNVSVAWEELSGGPALVIEFDFDFSDENNKYVSSFGYTLTGNGETTPLIESVTLNKTSTSQRVEFTYALNTQYYGLFQTSFTELKIAAYDSFGNNGPVTTITSIPSYTPDLCTPIITVTSIPMGYSVNLTDVCTKPYEFISVEEIVSDAGTAPTTGYQQVYLSDIKPANIVTPTTEARWVKARYTSKSGLYGSYSNAVKVTPTNPISVDLIPPGEVASVSAAWSGDNIVVSYTLPSTDAGVRFKIALTAPNSSVGYFYFFPVAGTLNQTATISKADLFLQFGSHYSSYTGLIKSIDASDNQSAGVAFTVAQRANPLLGITPTFTTTALVNGYNVSYTLPAGAVYAEIYQKYTSWSGVTPYDLFTGTYASGGASGTNTALPKKIQYTNSIQSGTIFGAFVSASPVQVPGITYPSSVNFTVGGVREIYATHKPLIERSVNYYFQDREFLNGVIQNLKIFSKSKSYMMQTKPEVVGINTYDVEYRTPAAINVDVWPVSYLMQYIPEPNIFAQQYRLNKEVDEYALSYSTILNTGFRARFAIANNTSHMVLLHYDATDLITTNVRLNLWTTEIVANSDPEVIEKIIDPGNISETVQIDSKWIQSKDSANKLMSTMANAVDNFSKDLSLSIFGNPMIQVGDVVNLNYPLMGVKDQKYFVTSVSHDFSNGLDTKIGLNMLSRGTEY